MQKQLKYELEFVIHSSSQLLYPYISTSSGLSEWFADNVNIKGDQFIFTWGDNEEETAILLDKNDESVKFKWAEDEEDTFFEMRIVVDEITDDVSLIVTDFAEENELEEAKMIWQNRISDLKHVIGSA